MRLDCTATVNIRPCSRGGRTRGNPKARDHDLGGKENYLPCGIGDEERAQLSVPCGSAGKTRDFIVDTLTAWGHERSATAQGAIDRVQLTREKGAASRGMRTPLLPRLVQCVDMSGKPVHRLYDPPDPSQYNPMERCWGMMAWQWNGAQLIEVETRREWAKRMTGNGVQPIVKLSRQGSATGVSLSKAMMRAVEARLARHPLLPKWDILMRPAGAD